MVDRPADELLLAPDTAAALESVVVVPLRAHNQGTAGNHPGMTTQLHPGESPGRG